jgi:hypothetical protein
MNAIKNRVLNRIVLCTTLVIFLGAVPAFAADITGTWTVLVKAAPPNGEDLPITFVFHQEGGKLTGTVAVPDEVAPISNGKVDGDKISFVVTFSVSSFTYEGTITGDEIPVTVKPDNPNFPEGAFTLKRSK